MLVPQNHDKPTCACYVAHLHANRQGDRYSVTFDGKLIVSRSRDPECDSTAGALPAQGITGNLSTIAEKTGRPRIIIEIGGAARLCAKEGSLAAYHERAK